RHRGRGRIPSVSQWRTTSAAIRAAARTLSARIAGRDIAHCRALYLRSRPTELSVPSRAGTCRADADQLVASADREGRALALAGWHAREGARTYRDGIEAHCRAQVRKLLPHRPRHRAFRP